MLLFVKRKTALGPLPKPLPGGGRGLLPGQIALTCLNNL
jgi:hypothetical protein